MKNQDFELKKIAELMSVLDKIEPILYSIQNKISDGAKKRVCKYVLARYSWLFDWMKEE